MIPFLWFAERVPFCTSRTWDTVAWWWWRPSHCRGLVVDVAVVVRRRRKNTQSCCFSCLPHLHPADVVAAVGVDLPSDDALHTTQHENVCNKC